MRKSLSLGYISSLQNVQSYESLEPTNVEEIKVKKPKQRRKTITQSFYQLFTKETQKSPKESKKTGNFPSIS
jgi:hypothetical protein